MTVVTFETSDGRARYYLADDNAVPIQPVLNDLGFEDNRGLARNTLRRLCRRWHRYGPMRAVTETESNAAF